MAKGKQQQEIETDPVLLRTLVGHTGGVIAAAVWDGGRRAVSASWDKTMKVWDLEAGQEVHTLRGHTKGVNAVIVWDGGTRAISASADSTLKVWDLEAGREVRTLKGHTAGVWGVAVWDGGTRAISTSWDNTLKVWDLEAGRKVRTLQGHTDMVRGVAVWDGGRRAVSTSDDHTLKVWDLDAGREVRTLRGHRGGINGVAVWDGGRRAVSTSDDHTLKVWDLEAGREVRTLQGHTAPVWGVAVWDGGTRAISASADGTLKVWDLEAGREVRTLKGHTDAIYGVAVWDGGRRAVSASEDQTLKMWDLANALATAGSGPAQVQYRNAKVVLVGDSGVGKTGLGNRLVTAKWQPTPGSTHGMNVWTLHSESGKEVMLWDFAGQDEYRLVHQLFMDQTNVALLLYDPTKSNDTFDGVEYWEKALARAVGGKHAKMLVAARVDVGQVRMTPDVIEAYCKRQGYLGHHATSAELGHGCEALKAAILQAIPWDDLPVTTSPKVFERIKRFLEKVRGKRLLAREPDLFAEFWRAVKKKQDRPTEEQFSTEVSHVANAGLIKRLSFGGLVLLRPELLNGYASDIIDTARRHPAGLGAVSKLDVLAGRIVSKEQAGVSAQDRQWLLHATVEMFLNLGLALEQDGWLVFPSKFNRAMPGLVENPVVEVEFSFEGPVDNLYTTLIVKLYYGGIFKMKQLWKNAAEFLDGAGRVCGFQLKSRGDGAGILFVFYDREVADNDKALFLKVVADHFRHREIGLRRERVYRCTACGKPQQNREAIAAKIDAGQEKRPCEWCEVPIFLFDALEMLYRDDRAFVDLVKRMDEQAAERSRREGDLVSAAAELQTKDFRDWVGGTDVANLVLVFTDIVDSTRLNNELRDAGWAPVRDAHFARAQALIDAGKGRLVKNLGDGLMVAFRSAKAGVQFAVALERDPGHPAVKVRAGVHGGAVQVARDDVFGQEVNLAARVAGTAAKGGVVASDQAKREAERWIPGLPWVQHAGVTLKGFTEKVTLWSVGPVAVTAHDDTPRIGLGPADAAVPGGPVQLEIFTRLVDDWWKLATYFKIPAHDQAAFEKGKEPYAVWKWLESRRRLGELKDGLTAIGREDLAKLLPGEK